MNQIFESAAPGRDAEITPRSVWQREPSAEHPPSWTDCFDPRRPEAFLAFCSAWCSIQLWFWPDQFAEANAFVATQIGLRGHEKSWAVFGLVAAALKLVGLACRVSDRWRGFSPGLLVSGLFLSVVFWMIVAVSRVFDFPHSITPVALIGFAIAAAWQLAEWRPGPHERVGFTRAPER